MTTSTNILWKDLVPKVYVKSAWADSWGLSVDYLQCLQCTDALMPTLGSAKFQFVYGSNIREGEAGFGWQTETKQGLLDKFVQVRLDMPGQAGIADATLAGHLVDSGVDFIAAGILIGTPVSNMTDGTATVVTGVSETDLTLEEDIFESGDAYSVGGDHMPVWTGIFAQDADAEEGAASGKQMISAYGPEHLLDRITVDGIKAKEAVGNNVVNGTTSSTVTGQLIDNSKDFITIGIQAGQTVNNTTDATTTTVTGVVSVHVLTVADDIMPSGKAYEILGLLVKAPCHFNERFTHGGTTRGNRSTAVNADGVYEFSSEGAVWTHQQALDYLCKYFRPGGITWSVGGSNELLAALTRSYDASGKTLRQVFDDLVDRRLGLAWRAVSDTTPGSTVSIEIYSRWGSSITEGDLVVSANPHQAVVCVNDAADPMNQIDRESAVVQHSTANKMDVIVVQGARVKTCFTVGFQDGTLEKAWTDAQETAYLAGAGDGSDYERNDEYRKSDVFERVFQFYRIPAAFDYQAGDGQGGTKHNAAPAMTSGAINAARQAGRWNRAKPILSSLPLKKGFAYTGASPTDNTPADSEPEYLAPMVWLKKDGVFYEAEHLTEAIEGDSGSCSVHSSSREIGIYVKGSPPHLLALNHWSGAEAANSDPEFDWEEMALTVCVELDDRPFRQSVIGAMAGNQVPKRLVIDVPECELHYIAEGTIVQRSDAGALVPFGGSSNVLRDDTEMLKAVMAAARAWYGVTRNGLEYTKRRVYLGLNPGLLVASVDNAGSSESINSIVESRTIDFTRMTTSVSCGFGEIDFKSFSTIYDRRGLMKRVAQLGAAVKELQDMAGSKILRLPDKGEPVVGEWIPTWIEAFNPAQGSTTIAAPYGIAAKLWMGMPSAGVITKIHVEVTSSSSGGGFLAGSLTVAVRSMPADRVLVTDIAGTWNAASDGVAVGAGTHWIVSDITPYEIAKGEGLSFTIVASSDFSQVAYFAFLARAWFVPDKR